MQIRLAGITSATDVEVEVADALAKEISVACGGLLFDEGQLWCYDISQGIFAAPEDADILNLVYDLHRAKTGGGVFTATAARANAILKVMKSRVNRNGFFAHSQDGVSVQNGFLAVDGNTIFLKSHFADQRQRSTSLAFRDTKRPRAQTREKERGNYVNTTEHKICIKNLLLRLSKYWCKLFFQKWNNKESMMSTEYRKTLDLALQAEHGVQLPFGNASRAGSARAHLCQLRERLQHREACHAYDTLNFHLVGGDLVITRDEPIDAHVSLPDPILITEHEAPGAGLGTR